MTSHTVTGFIEKEVIYSMSGHICCMSFTVVDFIAKYFCKQWSFSRVKEYVNMISSRLLCVSHKLEDWLRHAVVVSLWHIYTVYTTGGAPEECRSLH